MVFAVFEVIPLPFIGFVIYVALICVFKSEEGGFRWKRKKK